MQRHSSAIAYREADILTATPTRLVVITFDGLLAAMSRAKVGIALSNIEVTVTSIGKAREFVAELLLALDHEKGGDVARRLGMLYTFVLGELQEIARRPDATRLERNIAIMRELREAFVHIDALPSSTQHASVA